MTNPANLDPDGQARLDAIRRRSPVLTELVGHVRRFADMMSNLHGANLPQWMDAVTADDLPGLHSFVDGLKRDLPAVTAGLTLPWRSGAVEGQSQPDQDDVE